MKATAFSQWAGLVGSFAGRHAQVRELVDYCRVFSCEDAMRWAMQAYLQASRFLAASEGPWVEGGIPWSSPHGFADDFQHEFERRLWDACERSPRYREVQAWKDQRAAEALAGRGVLVDDQAVAESELLHPQMPELPRCGTVVAESEGMGCPVLPDSTLRIQRRLLGSQRSMRRPLSPLVNLVLGSLTLSCAQSRGWWIAHWRQRLSHLSLRQDDSIAVPAALVEHS